MDNGSTDGTGGSWRELAGATVIREPRRGYGQRLPRRSWPSWRARGAPPEVLVFLDADYSATTPRS